MASLRKTCFLFGPFKFGVATSVVCRVHAPAQLCARLIVGPNLHCRFARGTGEVYEFFARKKWLTVHRALARDLCSQPANCDNTVQKTLYFSIVFGQSLSCANWFWLRLCLAQGPCQMQLLEHTAGFRKSIVQKQARPRFEL